MGRRSLLHIQVSACRPHRARTIFAAGLHPGIVPDVAEEWELAGDEPPVVTLPPRDVVEHELRHCRVVADDDEDRRHDAGDLCILVLLPASVLLVVMVVEGLEGSFEFLWERR